MARQTDNNQSNKLSVSKVNPAQLVSELRFGLANTEKYAQVCQKLDPPLLFIIYTNLYEFLYKNHQAKILVVEK